MKKITRLSLVACLAMGTYASANAFIDDAKVTAEIKAQYFTKENAGNAKDKDVIGVVGGNLGVVSGSVSGIKVGLTLQGSAVVTDDIEGTNSYADFMDADGVVASEAYLSYGMKKTELKIGRQYISTPLLAGSGSRMIKQSFQGLTVKNSDLPGTTVMAAYINEYQDRTDGKGGVGEFKDNDTVGDGVTTLYLKNNSVEKLTIQAQYLQYKGNATTKNRKHQYVDAAYNFGKGTSVAVQYMGSKESGSDSASLVGVKASTNIGMINVTGLYTITGSKGTVQSGVGGAADKAFTALPLHGGGVTYKANTDTMVAVFATKVSAATIAAYYGVVDSPDSNNVAGAKEITAFGGFVQYAVNKKASVKVMYESADFNTLKYDSNRFRIYTSYKF